mgnify:CR=1 FL=1
MHEPPYWRDRPQNERLVARECKDCGYVAFPEFRETCKRCGGRPAWRETRLAERGEVRSYVVQNRLPEEFETPLPLAVVDMPQRDGEGEPARVYGLFTETSPDDMDVGMVVEADFRRIFDVAGLPVHAFKFKVPREARR